jgi:molybdate transport system regulatory protein
MSPCKPPSATAPTLVQGELTLIGGLNAKLFRLLKAIAATGSITKAAREVGLSYKGAWEMIDRANNLSPELLVDTAIGGRFGGGTRLTPAGAALLELFFRLQEEHRTFLARINQELAANPSLRFLSRRQGLKTSARNQWFGTVRELRAGPLAVEVVVSLRSGNALVAAVTWSAAESLGLAPGKEVVALLKAPQVMVVKDFDGYRCSAANRLAGTISRIAMGAVSAEIVLKLKSGETLAATLTKDSLAGLGFAEGDNVLAVFAAGSVILGVAEGPAA